MNIQGWFPLGLISLISLQSKGLSRVFSSDTVQKHQFFGALPPSWVYHTWLLLFWGRFPFWRNCYHKLSGEFYHKCMLNFIKRLFCFYCDDHIVFILQFVNVYHADWWILKKSLHPWDKSHLIFVVDPFNVLLDSVCWFFFWGLLRLFVSDIGL